jgi:hypothetical protein
MIKNFGLLDTSVELLLMLKLNTVQLLSYSHLTKLDKKINFVDNHFIDINLRGSPGSRPCQSFGFPLSVSFRRGSPYSYHLGDER